MLAILCIEDASFVHKSGDEDHFRSCYGRLGYREPPSGVEQAMRVVSKCVAAVCMSISSALAMAQGAPSGTQGQLNGLAIRVAQAAPLSSTCRFNQGPRAGQTQSYRGLAHPIPIGSPCHDGQGSNGVAVPDGSSSGNDQVQMSSTCRFNQGPRSGQVQSYRGRAQPIPVGSPCHDAAGSTGTAVPEIDSPVGNAAASTSSTQMSHTCRFTQGPRAGQVENYRGRAQPIPVGSPCHDGRGSSGSAVVDRD